MKEKPRYPPGWSEDCEHRMTFLCIMGEYDLWWDSDQSTYSVVCDHPPDSVNEYNYTDYTMGADGNIHPDDNDVVLDPYHMCLLYQYEAEHEMFKKGVTKCKT
jgi:hypothetical protein